jgi:hypothetical protein
MLARWIAFALYLGAVGLLGGWLIVRLRHAVIIENPIAPRGMDGAREISLE